MIDRDRNGLDMDLVIQVGVRFYSRGGLCWRGRRQARGERGWYRDRGVCEGAME